MPARSKLRSSLGGMRGVPTHATACRAQTRCTWPDTGCSVSRSPGTVQQRVSVPDDIDVDHDRSGSRIERLHVRARAQQPELFHVEEDDVDRPLQGRVPEGLRHAQQHEHPGPVVDQTVAKSAVVQTIASGIEVSTDDNPRRTGTETDHHVLAVGPSLVRTTSRKGLQRVGQLPSSQLLLEHGKRRSFDGCTNRRATAIMSSVNGAGIEVRPVGTGSCSGPAPQPETRRERGRTRRASATRRAIMLLSILRHRTRAATATGIATVAHESIGCGQLKQQPCRHQGGVSPSPAIARRLRKRGRGCPRTGRGCLRTGRGCLRTGRRCLRTAGDASNRPGTPPAPATVVVIGKCERESWRRRPDLNRGWRFCRPLPYHLATAPSGRQRGGLGKTESGAGKRDSNPRLRPWQGRTLPLSYSARPGRQIKVPQGATSLQDQPSRDQPSQDPAGPERVANQRDVGASPSSACTATTSKRHGRAAHPTRAI